MTDPRRTYKTRLDNLRQATDRQKRILRRSSILRIVVFLTAALLAYLALQGFLWMGYGSLGLAVLFAYLVARHQDLKYELRRLKELIGLNETELRVLDGDFSDLPEGSSYLEHDHAFAEDLDLFGQGSFFQYMNRTGLTTGSAKLAKWLGSNETEQIPDKQAATRELAPLIDWRQEFTATARLISTPISEGDLATWMSGYKPFLPGWVRHLPAVFSLISLATGLFVVLGGLPPWPLVVLFFTGLLITLPYAKKIGHLAGMTGKMQEVFRQYGRLVAQVEAQPFQGKRLQELKASLSSTGIPVSEILRSLSRRISALDQRNNLLVAVFGNAFFLWDLRQAYSLERWIESHGAQVPHWFGALSGFDACNSMGNFAYNHPRYVFPEIQEEGQTAFKVQQLAHPLLFGQVVRNDVRIGSGHFLVITGANMAGKSTFLRAVSLCLVMANSGLPVCAESMAYTPIPLITSMRTTDSLSRQESYFFAELQRLKRIVDHLKGSPYFVVLDEILKGTNSKDKAKGSREFLERLLKMQATGLIATHDLSLCEVAGEQPQVQNCFFDVEIREGELYFDYRLKPGVCSNMNASFLLRKLGVVEGNP